MRETRRCRGGRRPGAGRPRADVDGKRRRKHSIYCTDKELKAVRKYLRLMRQNADAAKNHDGSSLSLF